MSSIISNSEDDHNDGTQNKKALMNVKAVISEHFINYLFVVMDERGRILYNYTNTPIGKTLVREAKEMIEEDTELWMDWEEEDGRDED